MVVSRKNRQGLRTWIEVNRKAIRHNFGVFRNLIVPRTKLMAVVKSNAYGHDLIQFSKEVEKLGADPVRSREGTQRVPLEVAPLTGRASASNGADFLGVDSMVEARALRREGVKLPILVLGYTMPELFEEAAKDNISLTVSSSETLDALKTIKLPNPLKIHIKVDTGMCRQGFLAKDLPKILGFLKSKIINHNSPSILIEGLFTHLASAKNPAFPNDTRDQLVEFSKWIVAFKKAGLHPIVHAAATAGALLYSEAHFDMVRIGIGLYGLWPAKEVKEYLKDRVTLYPALVWKSIITEIKRLPKGSRIGYDLTETLPKDSMIAVVPIGYWHGYPRALSSIGRVMVNGQECKALGRVSMDMLTVDVSGVRGVKVGDEIIILDSKETSPASAESLGYISDSSWYELITRLNPLIKRMYK